MALEAVVLFQQQQGRSRFGCGAMAGGPWSGLFGGVEGLVELSGAGAGSWEAAARPSSMPLLHGFQELDNTPAAVVPPVDSGGSVGPEAAALTTTPVPSVRRKRRRARAVKNKEEEESQRMTHIAVERNRRKQMNEYLAVLRSLMPSSYAQRVNQRAIRSHARPPSNPSSTTRELSARRRVCVQGDQASIVGGAINFVKELEQLLQSLEARRRSAQRPAGVDAAPFAGFFTFPQYSMRAAATAAPENAPADATHREGAEAEDASGSKPSAVADVEATMVESHANLRVLSRRRPRQLLRLVVGLHGHRLTVLHLNMSSAGQMVLYSFSLKVDDDCQLTSVDEIAAATHQIVEKIHQEQGCSLE
ncbi:Transcription factor bHLH94 [Dichanthelium oligosanthes]|uniref:Transcription factor bHLH94 n=1 Tax=Dichanthelium oligosanthes TaxID=888268 RepID=A0A1E5VRR2_9POAL|nr:Transcription factor bHLH94 [Dichanthelium oligosanthes]